VANDIRPFARPRDARGGPLPAQGRQRAVAALASLALALNGCATLGPAALSNGRGTYNAVINETEDQQMLAMLVRQRYGETFGLLAVSSVTASLRVSATVAANIGIGSARAYEGNLVPLAAGAVYEENPTISYVPLRGEEFVQRMLAPVTGEQVTLLGHMSTREVEVLRFLIRRANALVNPLYTAAPLADPGAFDRFLERFVRLRERGHLETVHNPDGGADLIIHGYSGDETAEVQELLRSAGIDLQARDGETLILPVRFAVGPPRRDGIDIETPSALEVLEAASAGVDVPEPHLADGIAESSTKRGGAPLIHIRSSSERPDAATVAVEHRGWWFYVDARDTPSKQAFVILRTLFGLRMDEAASKLASPVLTVPVD
jgi:hypothetical protein